MLVNLTPNRTVVFPTDKSVVRRTWRENQNYQNREMLREFILQPSAKYSRWLNSYNYER